MLHLFRVLRLIEEKSGFLSADQIGSNRNFARHQTLKLKGEFTIGIEILDHRARFKERTSVGSFVRPSRSRAPASRR